MLQHYTVHSVYYTHPKTLVTSPKLQCAVTMLQHYTATHTQDHSYLSKASLCTSMTYCRAQHSALPAGCFQPSPFLHLSLCCLCCWLQLNLKRDVNALSPHLPHPLAISASFLSPFYLLLDPPTPPIPPPSPSSFSPLPAKLVLVGKGGERPLIVLLPPLPPGHLVLSSSSTATLLVLASSSDCEQDRCRALLHLDLVDNDFVAVFLLTIIIALFITTMWMSPCSLPVC